MMYRAYQRDYPAQPLQDALQDAVGAYTAIEGHPPTLLLVNARDAALTVPGCRTQVAAWINRGCWGLADDPRRNEAAAL
jgi:hypothetical protein